MGLVWRICSKTKKNENYAVKMTDYAKAID